VIEDQSVSPTCKDQWRRSLVEVRVITNRVTMLRIQSLIDGCSELLTEIHTAPKDVRTYIASGIAKLLVAPAFLDALPGYLFAAARWRRGGAHSEECSSSVLITPHSPC
jgi:hypothetical protein